MAASKTILIVTLLILLHERGLIGWPIAVTIRDVAYKKKRGSAVSIPVAWLPWIGGVLILTAGVVPAGVSAVRSIWATKVSKAGPARSAMQVVQAGDMQAGAAGWLAVSVEPFSLSDAAELVQWERGATGAAAPAALRPVACVRLVAK